eukprot:1490498-Pleurochrysis_carterae.AAC.3
MLMIRGFSPVSSSNDEALVLEGPLVRVEDIDGVRDGVVPKRDGRAAGHQRRSSQFHDGPNGALGDSIELTHVRRARGPMHSCIRRELCKFTGEEISGVVAV